MPQLIPRAQLDIAGGSHFERAVAIGQFTGMHSHLRKTFQVTPAIEEEAAARIPASWVGINQRHVQNFAFPAQARPARQWR